MRFNNDSELKLLHVTGTFDMNFKKSLVKALSKRAKRKLNRARRMPAVKPVKKQMTHSGHFKIF